MSVIKNKTKGVSLPMAMGMISLILLISVGANELIIRAIRSVQKIEASDKAYFAAEAGIEDALYELSPHFAGYETPDLKTDGVRKDNFNDTGTIRWNNEWTILSYPVRDEICGYENEWDTDKKLCGKFYENQKLIISLFNDNTSVSNVRSNAIGSSESLIINTIKLNTFSITFRLPTYVVDENDLTELTIDNDGDALINGVNEDGKVGFDDSYRSDNACPYLPGGVVNEDDDCDGRENEDSPQDPVIYWKISDNAGNTFTPKRGCSTDADPSTAGFEICEMDFKQSGSDVLFTLNETNNTSGVCEGPADGICDSPLLTTINDFVNAVEDESKLQIEFNIVAPLEHSDGFKKVAIPYLEYGINYGPNDANVPSPFFTLESDGYYRDFKQSITATISPKTAVPLFDFTIIQQQ